jgi:glyoxalase family protein
MQKLQSQAVHHITIVGADRQTSIEGRFITIFTDEGREPDPTRTPTDPGCVHLVAFALSQATFPQAVERPDERGIDRRRTLQLRRNPWQQTR